MAHITKKARDAGLRVDERLLGVKELDGESLEGPDHEEMTRLRKALKELNTVF
jgi:hypothetical protein